VPDACSYELVVSASRDESARLWDLTRGRCLAIFAGSSGHTEQVLTADIHHSGQRLVTGGVDHSVKIWDLGAAAIRQAIVRSREYNPLSPVPFTAVACHFPEYSSHKVHTDYVDCARWWGDVMLSKAPHEEQISCWTRPDATLQASDDAMLPLIALQHYTGDVWYLKFAVDAQQRLCAAGNDRGEVRVWHLEPWLHVKRESSAQSEVVDVLPGTLLPLPEHVPRTVRAVCFSHDAQ
jgi:polycomb protein EED